MKKLIVLKLIIIFQIIGIIMLFTITNTEQISITPAKIENQKIEKKQNTDTSVFDKKIKKYNWSVRKDSSGTTYGLLYPTGIKNVKNVPLIVWLHGTGHYGLSKNTPDAGLPETIYNWKMENFYAYILCPSFTMIEKSRWTDSDVTQKVTNLLKEFLAKHDNIDKKHIVVIGHSGGGPGAFHYAIYLKKYFSKAIAISSPKYLGGVGNVKIPMLCFAGDSDTDWARENMWNLFAPALGKSKCFFIDGTHGSIPFYAFRMDNGYFTAMDGKKHKYGIANNNRSDLIEWLLDGVKVEKEEIKVEKEEIKIETEEYTIQEMVIDKIQPETSVGDVKRNISTNALEIKIYNIEEKELEEKDKVTTGTKIVFKNKIDTKTYTLIVTGDVNKDGNTDFIDLTILNKCRLNKLTPSDLEKTAGDIVKDGELDFKDLIKLNQFRLKKITKF